MIDLVQEQTSHFITGAHHMLLSITDYTWFIIVFMRQLTIMLSIGWSIKAHTGIPIPSIPLVMQENSTALRSVPAVTHQPNATGL